MKITKLNGIIYVECPYNENFVERIKNAGARWDDMNKAWVMDDRLIETARLLLKEIFGEDDTPSKKVNVRVKAKNEIHKTQGDVMIFGKIVSSAKGRDTGARIGEKVSYVKGGPKSGGSVKNWKSIVPEGSIISLLDVPELSLQQEDPDLLESIDYEVFNAMPNKIELINEKEILLARIAEIDAELAK